MELDTPGPAEPKRLCADRAAGQLDCARREVVGVVVPLEGVEALRQGRRDGIGGGGSVTSTGSQPTSGSAA